MENKGPVSQNNNFYEFINTSETIEMDNIKANFVTDYKLALGPAKSALIKQKIHLLEILTGCEVKNRYNVFLKYPNDTYSYIFKCKEESDCCSRNCIEASDRPMLMMIKYVKDNQTFNSNKHDDSDFVLEKPYTCSCFNLSRPQMIAYHRASNTKIGKVTHPFSCCNPYYEVYDEKDNLNYFISAKCCQCGFICPCNEVNFLIFSGERSGDLSDSNAIGKIIKLNAGCVQEMFTKADNFEIEFPENANPEQKLLLISTALLIDYTHFEKNDKKNKNNE